MAEVSVIIPVYNVKPYLRECLDSICGQSFRELEVICVDDGSTDGSLEILNEYREKDKRFTIHHFPENHGAARARNYGLKAARTPYIVFLDADDIYDKEMVEELYTAINNFDADLAVCEFDEFPEEAENIVYDEGYDFNLSSYSKKSFRLLELPLCELGKWGPQPVNKMIKADMIKAYGLEFQELSCANDVYFIEMCKFMAKRMIHTKELRPMSHLRRHQSASRISVNRDPMNTYKAYQAIFNKLKEFKVFDSYSEYFYRQLGGNLIGAMKHTRQEKGRQEFYRFLNREGMKALEVGTGEAWFKLDRDYQKILSGFLEYSYEARWFDKALYLQVLLKKNREKMEFLFSYIEKNTYQAGFFSAGVSGEMFLQYCRESGNSIQAFIDNDTKKQGTSLGGIKVCSLLEVLDEIDLIILPNRLFSLDMLRQVKTSKKDIRVFILYLYLEEGMEMEACIF